MTGPGQYSPDDLSRDPVIISHQHFPLPNHDVLPPTSSLTRIILSRRTGWVFLSVQTSGRDNGALVAGNTQRAGDDSEKAGRSASVRRLQMVLSDPPPILLEPVLPGSR